MPKVRLAITTNAHGQLDRVTVAHKFTDVLNLIKIQEQLSRVIESFKPYEPNRLHFTSFQFGIPLQFHKELRKQNPQLDYEEFMNQFLQLLIKTQASLTQITDIPPISTSSIDLFGSHRNPAIVLKTNSNQTIGAYRQDILSNTIEFLARCGIHNPEAYLNQSPILKLNPAHQFKPHITLGRAKIETAPSLNPPPFELKLSTPYLEHVEVM